MDTEKAKAKVERRAKVERKVAKKDIPMERVESKSFSFLFFVFISFVLFHCLLCIC